MKFPSRFGILAPILWALAGPLAAQTATEPAQEHGEHAEHAAHPGHEESAARDSGPAAGPQIQMSQEGSGTAWVPASSPMHGHGRERGPWRLMLHYSFFAGVTRQGSDQEVTEALTANWVMGMAERQAAGGKLVLRGMLSLEPLLLKNEGYPLLLQTGETADGEPLVDRQHPHDLFMELAVKYTRPLTRRVGLELYVAPSGEPALGPVAFPHRPSAAADPLAPLGHHWLDSTHIAFGVVTVGAYTRRVKVEGSWFNGREPDEEREDFDIRTPDSYSVRVSVNPSADWSLQASHGELDEPEALEPGVDVRRTVASAIYNRPTAGGSWASTLAWGRNKSEGDAGSGAYLFETVVTAGRHAVFGRAEYVEKTGHDFALEGGQEHDRLPVTGVAAGYSWQALRSPRAVVSIGGRAFVGFVNDTLEEIRYGTRRPVSGLLFVHIRPGDMHHQH